MGDLISGDILLQWLKPAEVSDLHPRVHRSWNGLVLKREREPGKSKQEWAATRLARVILPQRLAMPQTWGVIADEYYLSEQIGEPFDGANLDQIMMATDYLADLHLVSLDRMGLGAELRAKGFNHYEGGALKNRLTQELDIGLRAFAGHGIGRELDRFSTLVAETLERWSFTDDVVLGHGDFRAGNLRYRQGVVVPLDWVDFGLCDRSREVMTYINSIKADYRETALTHYVTLTHTNACAIRARGAAVAGIISMGSHARMLELGIQSRAICTAKFVKRLNRALQQCEI